MPEYKYRVSNNSRSGLVGKNLGVHSRLAQIIPGYAPVGFWGCYTSISVIRTYSFTPDNILITKH